MKQNLIIVLLTAAVTLLLVNLLEGRFPPVAQAAGHSGNGWEIGCTTLECYAVSAKGFVYKLQSGSSRADRMCTLLAKNPKTFEKMCIPWRGTPSFKIKNGP